MANKQFVKVRELWLADSKQKGQNNGLTEITATAAELNALDGSTVSSGDLNRVLDNAWNSISTTFVDGTDGTGTVQFVFKDVAGTAMASPVSGTFYVSEIATGVTVDALDNSLARLTNGYITLVDTTVLKYWNFITDATGKLGCTVTSNADEYFFCFVHPTGKLVISSGMTITG
jgi:hypothetical protein